MARAAPVAAATGIMEPIGALLGIGLSNGLAITYPIGLGLAAGSMIFVVSHEVNLRVMQGGYLEWQRKGGMDAASKSTSP